MSYAAYWLRLPEHTDMLTEGYFGISNNPNVRWNQHKCSKQNPHLANAIKLYGWDKIVKEIVLIADKEYCKIIEAKIRPEKNIGWNIEKGGGVPPVHFNNKFTLGFKHTKEANAAKSAREKGKCLGAKHPQYKGDIIATNISTGKILVLQGKTAIEAAGFDSGNVSKCLLGQYKQHKGHTFKRLGE